MINFNYYSHSPADTQSLGERIGKSLKPGIVIALIGELGCGKTLLTRGICTGLKVPLRQVNSPTFVLVNEYRGRLPVYHLDLYRLGDIADVVDIGVLDYLARAESGVMIIEWAEKVLDLLPDDYLKVKIEVLSARKRQLLFSAWGDKYEYLIEKVSKR
jgi:tRNA threonylcarbamoyladenosine biosynthesis protein TsaE